MKRGTIKEQKTHGKKPKSKSKSKGKDKKFDPFSYLNSLIN